MAPFLAGEGWTGDPSRSVIWGRRTQVEDSVIDSLCDHGHTPYRQIGHHAVTSAMRRTGIERCRDVVPSAHMSTTGDPS